MLSHIIAHDAKQSHGSILPNVIAPMAYCSPLLMTIGQCVVLSSSLFTVSHEKLHFSSDNLHPLSDNPTYWDPNNLTIFHVSSFFHCLAGIILGLLYTLQFINISTQNAKGLAPHLCIIIIYPYCLQCLIDT